MWPLHTKSIFVGSIYSFIFSSPITSELQWHRACDSSGCKLNLGSQYCSLQATMAAASSPSVNTLTREINTLYFAYRSIHNSLFLPHKLTHECKSPSPQIILPAIFQRKKNNIKSLFIKFSPRCWANPTSVSLTHYSHLPSSSLREPGSGKRTRRPQQGFGEKQCM